MEADGSCKPTILKPSVTSVKRLRSGHSIFSAIAFHNRIRFGLKMASTPGSMFLFKFNSSASRLLATPTQCFNLAALLVAISTGPRESISKITLSNSSGTAWYKSKGCFSWMASSIHCLGPLNIPNLYLTRLLRLSYFPHLESLKTAFWHELASGATAWSGMT